MLSGVLAGEKQEYDYIIAGAGAAGLSLLVRMIKSGNFTGKRILLVEKEPKIQNDRTWCFWETGDGFFEEQVFKAWPVLHFHSADFSAKLNIAPFKYKMIRGIDFYRYCFTLITSQPGITIKYGIVTEMHSDGASTWLLLDGIKYTAHYIFNSIILSDPKIGIWRYFLLQHFKGWVIETAAPVFKVEEATLMDFRVGQQSGTTFVYVMPFSPTKALVEYTLFSKELLQPHEYAKALHEYIRQNLGIDSYTIESEEYGCIPMTDHKFSRQQGNIIQMGTVGGQTKASSGYTFQFIQKHTASIIEGLNKGGQLHNRLMSSKKYQFYDHVLLNVLATAKMPGDKVFIQLFKNNPPQRIFRFLDNESSLREDVQLIASLPTLPFLKAGLQQIF